MDTDETQIRRLNCERQAAFGADFEAERDGFLDVLERVRLGLALADAAGNGRTLGHPHSILVPVNRHRKFHGLDLTHGQMVGKRTSCVEL